MPPRRRPATQRRGAIYLAVLGVSAIVAAMGVGLMYTVRLQGRRDALVADSTQARACAEAGVEIAAQLITSNSNWRTRTNGTWVNAMALGPGSVTVEVTDPIDSNLANDTSQGVLIKATGRAGEATHILSVNASPRGTAISSLGMALAAQGPVRIDATRIVNLNGGTLSTNGVLRNEGTIQGAARCSSTDGASVATLGTTTGAAALQMPSSGIISSYITRATVINLGATATIQDVVLTPSFNSLGGGLNADGVYVINASGADLTIRSIRLMGTLIINNSGRKVIIEGPALMQPARSDFPTLLATGGIYYKSSGLASLSESTEGCNFNPVGSPYLGDADGDTTDTYPSRFEGLMHAQEMVELDNNAVISGCVLAGASSDAVRIYGNVSITHSASLVSSPPIGYTSGGTPALVSGTWRQLVNP
ncbi:MAG TPA: hypothetical protein VD997_11465 [Phycisphaerales bacterium]|nr:hypothetical protein [Phycisphaerales bacterium]